jgi:hypothetical protein
VIGRRTILAATVALVATLARAQELGPVMPSVPAAIESGTPAAPITVREQDADTILGTVAPHRETPPPTPGDGTREFTADEPPKPVLNQSSRFVFADETDRPTVPVKSLPERRAAVEAVRQSMQRPAGGR